MRAFLDLETLARLRCLPSPGFRRQGRGPQGTVFAETEGGSSAFVRSRSDLLGRHHDIFADISAWICIVPPSRGHDGDRIGTGIALARARKERLASIGVVRVIGDERRADHVMAYLEAGRDRDIGRSHILPSRIVRRVGKHPSEQGLFSMAVIDEFAEAFLLRGYPQIG